MATPKVRSAISASVSDLAPDLPRRSALHDGRPYRISLVTSSQLSAASEDVLYELFDANISPLSAGTSMAHTPGPKRIEMFDPQARYLLATSLPQSSSLDYGGDVTVTESDELALAMPGAMPAPAPRSGALGKGKRRAPPVEVTREELLGYCGFRFDTEQTAGTRDAEVVYCYELQIAPQARRMGLGKVLIDEMEVIGRRRGMDKAMLTCLKNNDPALSFYAKQGYTPDEIDPTRMEEEEEWEDVGSNPEEEDGSQRADYRILSKVLKAG
ncbi:hypothetical protein EHS25_010197 [Saitozyma podzolica]|uniref:N-alpha-acetyltransferase 40 n=1 Tax=Saitozyma podzolica TaxID=1890683 RepID=A0A427YIW8_9TREE|nr:hypothetical protein EHS25_010197 [Saitozyma podzolica]